MKTERPAACLSEMPVVVALWSAPARLAHARRLVFDGALLVAAQQTRLRRLRAAGYDTSIAASLLDTFEDAQLAFIRRLAFQEANREP